MGDLGAEPRLVVPEGMVIDDCVRVRLERGLARAPSAAAGIAAETGDLPPGASYRVHAEWMALEPRAEPPREATRVAGAALLRPHVDFDVRDGVVEVASGSLLIDLGAHVHDPYRPIGPLQVASELGRPPFPLRPVVVLLGCETEGLADWARRLTNRLVRRDVEARVAVPDVAEGMHLTRPCLPSEETIRALAPDVVIALDDAARDQVGGWLVGDRSTVVVELDPRLSADAELVPWQIGRAAGRLRARIGPRVDASALAALVGRLCAGPHPMPPSDRPELIETRTPVRERWTSSAATKPGCVVITGARLGVEAATRLDGLVDNLAAASVTVARAPLAGGLPGSARGAAVVLLAGVGSSPEVTALLADRRAAGLPTVLDLGPDAVAPARGGADAAAHLTEAAAALGTACGLVVAPPGAVLSAARAHGLRALAVPTLLTRGRASALRDARTRFNPEPPLVLGWHIGTAGAPAPAYVAVVAEVVAKILADRADVHVELVGDAARSPITRRGERRVTVLPDAGVDPGVLARWTAHLWTPALRGDEVAEDAPAFEAASCAGVPTIMPAVARGTVDGFVSPHVMVRPVDQPDDWARALRHVLGNADRRASRAEEAMRRADAIDALATSRTVVSRLMGWARYQCDGIPA